MTDEKSFFHSTQIGNGFDRAFISWDPNSRTLSVFLTIEHFLGDGERGFTYRVDKTAAVSVTAKYKNDMAQLSDADVSTFVEQVKPGKILEVDFLTYSGEPWKDALDIRGANKAMSVMLEDCYAIPANI
jgi:hypothetical protein